MYQTSSADARNLETFHIHLSLSVQGLYNMCKGDENRDATGAEELLRQLVRKPRILARRVARKNCPNTPSCVETVTLNPQQFSMEQKEYENDEWNFISNPEAILSCAALDETLRKNPPYPVTEYVPIFDGSQLRMRFGNEEDVSDRVRMIGFALAEHALKALANVSENESRFQFTFPKEAAKVNLNSADDPASVSQLLSGSHQVEQDKPSTSSQKPPRSPIILRITRTKSGNHIASTNYRPVSQHVKREEYCEDQGKIGVVKRQETDDYDSPSTSLEYSSSIKQKEADTDADEHLTSEEKALIDQVLLLCSQFIKSTDCDDANWYSKLKKAIYLRMQQLLENTKNAVQRRRELRERNEELRKLYQHITTEQDRISSSPSCIEDLDL